MHQLFNFRCAARDLRRLKDVRDYEHSVTARTASVSDLLREAVRAYINMRVNEDPDLARFVAERDMAYDRASAAEKAAAASA